MNKVRDSKIKRLKELAALAGNDAMEEILSFAGDKDYIVRLTVIDLITELDSPIEAKGTLIKLVDDADWEVRCEAIEALSYYTGDDVGSAITPRLKEKKHLVRVFAAEALGDLEFKPAIPDLQKALSDENTLVRGYAADALSKMDDRAQIPVLEEALKREKRNWARLNFYVALYRLGEKDYFKPILKMLKARSFTIRVATANSLLEIVNQDNVAEIVKSLKKSLLKEDTIAARSTMEKALSELCERFDVDDCDKSIDNS